MTSAMTTNPTPGPWLIRDEGAPYIDVMGPDGRLLATAYHHTRHPGLGAILASIAEAEANARLIAAAPSLLDAVKDLIATMDYMRQRRPDLFGESEGKWLSPQMSSGYQKGKAALAKATEP
jgi:hypothetical protein